MITVAEVKEKLGEAYANFDETVIQSFISQREAELQELIGLADLSTAPYPSLLKRWLISKVCADVIARDLIGVDSADVLDYSIAELRESKSENVRLKVTWIETLNNAAEMALSSYFLKTRGYRAVRL